MELFALLGQSWELLATWQNFVFLAVGVAVGTFVGAIPGMTTPMAVALTLPFTFAMPPVTGILLLLGVYKGGFYGGSITAILINAPGTPAAACTALDGYPLAKKGEARRALDMALYASVVADFISNLALIFLAGLLASFALQFKSPQMFTLIVFSLTIIAGVSGDALLKGLGAAALGLLLAVVGSDMDWGTGRLTFGSFELYDGFSFIPVLIGLFALPEIIAFYTRKPLPREENPLAGQGLRFAEFLRNLPTIIRGSFIGVILGAIPGIGGAPAAFMSYSETQRNAKDRSQFGKGNIAGVAAAESGNNGVAGATMIPLLALGIPGDITTAIILGAFMIHDLRPGPLMFQDNLPLIYAMFIGIMFSSLFLLIIGKGSIRLIARIADIPHRVLFPVVLTLCAFGSFAISSSIFNVGVMFVMGAVGYVMRLLGIPTAPFLIAFILGPLFEENLRRSLVLSKGDWTTFFQGPISLFFWALTLFVIVLTIWRNRKA